TPPPRLGAAGLAHHGRPRARRVRGRATLPGRRRGERLVDHAIAVIVDAVAVLRDRREQRAPVLAGQRVGVEVGEPGLALDEHALPGLAGLDRAGPDAPLVAAAAVVGVALLVERLIDDAIAV